MTLVWPELPQYGFKLRLSYRAGTRLPSSGS